MAVYDRDYLRRTDDELTDIERFDPQTPVPTWGTITADLKRKAWAVLEAVVPETVGDVAAMVQLVHQLQDVEHNGRVLDGDDGDDEETHKGASE